MAETWAVVVAIFVYLDVFDDLSSNNWIILQRMQNVKFPNSSSTIILSPGKYNQILYPSNTIYILSSTKLRTMAKHTKKQIPTRLRLTYCKTGNKGQDWHSKHVLTLTLTISQSSTDAPCFTQSRLRAYNSDVKNAVAFLEKMPQPN